MTTSIHILQISKEPFAPEMILLISFGYFSAKHFLGDFVLQNTYQYSNKGRYGHPGGVLHAAIHGVLSLPLFVLLPGIQPGWFATIILGEVIAHYHIDWGKEQILRKTKWNVSDHRYWNLFGLDQLLHMTCYIIMSGLIIISF